MSIRFNGQLFSTHAGQTLEVKDAAAFSDYARAHKLKNDVPEDILKGNIQRTIALLKAIYAKLGCTAEITSFFRGTVLNSAVGGKVKPPSAHMDGRAVDSIPQGVSVQDAFDKLKPLADELEFDQLIIEHDRHGNTWLHSSVAADGKKPRKMAFALEKQPVPDRYEKG
jgi:hypothetical protein